MRHFSQILLLTFLLSSCQSGTEQKRNVLQPKRTERFFPENKTTETFDTLISDKQIRITIVKSSLDTYVSREYGVEGGNQTDQYRDAGITLNVKLNTETLVDTFFRKEQFASYSDKEFISNSIFHHYWMNKIDDHNIVFFGVISIPETDITLDFSHTFDLNKKELKFEQMEEEE